MSATQLMTDLARLGIHIEAHGDRLRYSPRSAVTPDLADRMKAHKGDLLAILRCRNGPTTQPIAKVGRAWIKLRRSDGGMDWVRSGTDVDHLEVIDLPDPCPQCGMLEMWQTLPGDWRCQRCDSPTTAWRLLERAERFKQTPPIRQDE